MTTFGLLAPMRPELRPLVKKLSLERPAADDGAFYRASAGNVEFVATITGIGTQAATEATERLLDGGDVDHVVVVGIAGGMAPAVKVGDLVVPEAVIDGRDGAEYVPNRLGDVTPKGKIRTGDEFDLPKEELARLYDDGVVAVDMETGAVAAVCSQRQQPWSAFRAISDMANDDTVDPAVINLARPDGSPNVPAVVRYLLRRPWRIRYLSKLAKGSAVACDAAATAAVDACTVR